MQAANRLAYRWGSSYSLSCLLLPCFLFCFPVLPSLLSLSVLMDVVLLSCVDHPLGAASLMPRSCPKAAGTNWGQLGTAGSWPSPTQAQIPTASPQPVQSSWCRTQRDFGRSLQLHPPLAITLCSRHCIPQLHLLRGALPSLFGGFVLEPFHLWRPNPALSSWMCFMLGIPGVFCLLGL